MKVQSEDPKFGDSQSANGDNARPILEWVARLLAEPKEPESSPDQWLAELAKIIQSSAAGLAGVIEQKAAICFRSKNSGALPWDTWPDLLTQLEATGERQFPDGRICFLAFTPCGNGACWLLWLEFGSGRSLSAGEKSALGLAAAALARRVADNPSGSDWEGWLAQLRRKQRLEDAGKVAGRIAHDFNNVLAGILGFTELSLSQMPADVPARALVGEVYEAALQGTRLVKLFGLFSRRSRMSSQPYRLVDSLARLRARLAKLTDKQIELKASIPGDLPWLALDGDSVQIVLDQLLDNAVESMSQNGIVKLSARELRLAEADCLSFLGACSPGRHIEIVISDSGSGLSAEAREKILSQPFFTNKLRHRGLGLATVYGLLAAARGGIRMQDGEPTGTSVHCVIPVSTVPADPSPSWRPSTNSLPQRPHADRVLVVDDDPMTLGFMCTTLQQAGYQVHSACDGKTALDSFDTANEPFRLVLSDVRMPHMTGFELAQQLLERNPSLPILFISGHVPVECVPEAMAGRQYDFLPKPFRSECLLTAVRSALAREPIS
jgi:two-component system, cell cycle sensor histidine kinase and response regulator CckA